MKKLMSLFLAVYMVFPAASRAEGNVPSSEPAAPAVADPGISQPQSAPVVSSIKGPEEHKPKRGFWSTKSKAKLWWGIALLAVGGGVAVTGFTKVTQNQNVDPSTVSLIGPVSIFDNITGSTVQESVTANARNNSGQKVNAVVSTTYSSGPGGTGTVFAKPTTNFSVDGGSTWQWTTTATMTVSERAASSLYFKVESAQIEVKKTKSAGLGYAGVGAAALGTSFILSYLFNKAPAKIAMNTDVEPVFYAQAHGGYEGFRTVYRF